MPVKKSERIQEIPLSELHPFKNHPFRVVDDEAMQRTVEAWHNLACWLQHLPAPVRRADMN